jgi:hypothetical protein
VHSFDQEEPMPDDPNKRGPADRGRVSQQEHEQEHQKRKQQQERADTNQGQDQSAGQRGGNGKKNPGAEDE